MLGEANKVRIHLLRRAATEAGLKIWVGNWECRKAGPWRDCGCK